MKLLLVTLAALAIVAGDFVVPKAEEKYGDVTFLKIQKFFLDILKNIHLPLVHEEYVKSSVEYLVGEEHYTNYTPVVYFIQLEKEGLVPKGYVFSVFNEHHLKEVVGLFNLFYYAKDWDTLYKNVLWARQHVNEGMFVYALTVAVVHRKDLAGIVLPPPYEICPYLFFNSRVIKEAMTYKMQDVYKYTHDYVVVSNYTSQVYPMNEESKLAYFTEDIGWNAYYYYFHVDYPVWLGGPEFGLEKDRRGEQYLYMYQQLLARYYLERLSNGLGAIPQISLMKPIKIGYNPMLQHYNGSPFAVRPNYYEVYNDEEYDVLNIIEDHERRIRELIDYGVYTTQTGEKINFREPKAVEHLGNIISGNPSSVHPEYYGRIGSYLRVLLGGGVYDHHYKNKVSTSVLESYETTMRDPVFYQYLQRIVQYYHKFQSYLKPYTKEELIAPGVHVEDVSVGKLLTYFDYTEVDITSVVGMGIPDVVESVSSIPEYVVKAKQMRLNHKPFTVGIDVSSDKVQKVVVRVYMGPKYDQYGNVYSLGESRHFFVELDQFVYELQIGKNVIKRDSKDFSFNGKDRSSFVDYYKKVLKKLEGESKYVFDNSESHCSFPDRLVLPKGSANGLPLVFYVVVTPYVETDPPQYSTFNPYMSCGIGSGSRFVDNLPFGYPFNRPIVCEKSFVTSNMYFKDVIVYHKVAEL